MFFYIVFVFFFFLSAVINLYVKFCGRVEGDGILKGGIVKGL